MKLLVSIIIPIYNVEKYIEKCVISLLHQDYENIEIILVDDGSSDSSLEKIQKLATTNDRILVIHQENRGVSAARNAGLRVAKGKYIMFVDGDDWVDHDYVSYFMSLIETSDCSIAMNKNFHSILKTQSNSSTCIVDSETAIEWIYLGNIFVAVWNKIYDKDFLITNHIFFNEDIWYGEGMLFNIECLQYIDKVAIGEKSVYHQTFNPESAMRKFNLKSNYCGLSSLDLQKKLWKKKNEKIALAWNYHKYCFNKSIIDGLTRSNMIQENKMVFKNCVHNLRKDILIPLKVEKTFKRKLSWICYYFFPSIMAKRSARKFNHTLKLKI